MKKTKLCACNTYYTCKLCRSVNTYTYEEIAEYLGCSRQRVQQIEKEALQKFKNNLMLLGIDTIEEVL